MRSVLMAGLLAAAPSLAMGADDDHSKHLSEADGVRILHAWTNATDEDHAFVFMEIRNARSKEIMLVSAATSIASEVHLVATDPASGDEIELDGVPVPAASEMELAPGGLFLELHDLDKVLAEGQEFEMEVEFADGTHLDVHVEVEAADARAHSHAGHNH